MVENDDIITLENVKQEKYEKYNLLMDCMFRTYEREFSRKGRLDAKAAGYFSVLGIFFAAFLVIEPRLIEIFLERKICQCLYVINLICVFAYIILFFLSFTLLKEVYGVKGRAEAKIIEVWTEYFKHPFDEVCERIKETINPLYKELLSDNEEYAKKLKTVQSYFLSQSIIIIFLFIILLGININFYWR